MNLTEQIGETSGYTTVDYLDSWQKLFPEITVDIIIVDPNFVEDQHECERAAQLIGARVFSIDVATSGTTHDPEKLARALRQAAIELGGN
jgi:2-phospho-L-lactate transferase/gluconeogenesis factor (CofD/UPF0052 family)